MEFFLRLSVLSGFGQRFTNPHNPSRNTSADANVTPFTSGADAEPCLAESVLSQ
jgi:hypothetical protein